MKVHADQQLVTTQIWQLLGNTSSARLKSLSRIIASESERTLCANLLMTIACQFRVVKWTKKPRNLSSGAIASEKLATHELKYDEMCPIGSRHVL